MKPASLDDRSLTQVEAGVQDLAAAFSAILADPALLSRFLRACAILKSLESRARAGAVQLLEQGEAIPGVDYHPGRVTATVPAEAILEAAESNGQTLENLKTFVYLIAPVSRAKYRNFCRKVGATPRSNRIQAKTAAPYVVVGPLLLRSEVTEKVVS
jgi:hypothetical protein